MHRRILVGAAALALCAGLALGLRQFPRPPADPAPETAAAYPLAAAPMRLRALTWDFGVLPPGGEASRSFEIRNAGATPWTVKHVTSTCSCAAGRLPVKTVGPGETVRVEVAFRAPLHGGKASGHVMVEFAEPESPLFQLTVEAEVRGPLAADPPSLRFGPPAPGARPSRVVTLRNYGDRRVAITRVEAPEWLDVECRPVDETVVNDRPRQTWELIVRANPDKLRPASGSAALVVHADSDQVGPASIPVYLDAR